MTCDRLHLVGIVGTLLALLQYSPAVAQDADPHKLLAEADRLAWLRVWTRAEPLYAQAREAWRHVQSFLLVLGGSARLPRPVWLFTLGNGARSRHAPYRSRFVECAQTLRPW
jgi:hypothetical protein